MPRLANSAPAERFLLWIRSWDRLRGGRRVQSSAVGIEEVSKRTEDELRVELCSLGYPWHSLEGFVTNRLDIREAVPVLLRDLPKIDEVVVKEQIVRG